MYHVLGRDRATNYEATIFLRQFRTASVEKPLKRYGSLRSQHPTSGEPSRRDSETIFCRRLISSVDAPFHFRLTNKIPADRLSESLKARSSGGEHHLDAVRVWGSNPHAPTIEEFWKFPPFSPEIQRRDDTYMIRNGLWDVPNELTMNPLPA
jgi:hypothetical protein